jgi:hypothetical protein
MIDRDDIEAAVARGDITRAQADAIGEHARKRRSETGGYVSGEEGRFRLIGGFNDVFLFIGVALFVIGLLAAVFVSGSVLIMAVAAAGIVWLMAELLTARMRLTLPSILLAASFVMFVALAAAAVFGQTAIWQNFNIMETLTLPRVGLWFAGSSLAASALFYWRFGVPFATLLVAVSGIGIAFAALASYDITWPIIYFSPIILAAGIVSFLIAMWYDVSDPARVTARSDCAFWLHLLAAPLIVHTAMRGLAGPRDFSGSYDVRAVLVTVAVLALVAIIIDRRAILVAGLSYLAFAIAYTISALGHGASITAMLTFLVVGMFVLLLGVGWRPLRRLVIGLLPPFIPRHRLPPVQP